MSYTPRFISFKELVEIDGWTIKVYTISKTKEIDLQHFYQNALKELPKWLKLDNSFDASNDKIGFLILHEGTEGVFSIINWWVGKNMLNTHVFFTKHNEKDTFTKISGDGLGPCIWELEVINFERIAWTNNVLKQPIPSGFNSYLEEVYYGIF